MQLVTTGKGVHVFAFVATNASLTAWLYDPFDILQCETVDVINYFAVAAYAEKFACEVPIDFYFHFMSRRQLSQWSCLVSIR